MFESAALSDLWILPPADQCSSFGHVDWYLNWQMVRGISHKSFNLSPELRHIAHDYDVRLESPTTPANAPLMIASKGLLPTERVMVMPYDGDIKSWLESVQAAAISLQAQGVLIFLPAKCSPQKAEKIWQKDGVNCQAHFIEDKDVT